MSRKRNKGLDRRGRLMMLMWMSIWLGGSLWSGLHGGNGVLAAVWHGFLVLAGCMGVYLLGCCIYIFPEVSRHERERIRRERENLRETFEYMGAIDDEEEDSPSEMDLDISIDDDVDFDITVNDQILDLAEYEEEKECYLSSEHIDRYRLARLREFIRETVEGCDVFDTMPTLFDDPLLQRQIEEMV
ncbi:MAG: hypothetical protein IJV05_00665 [Muribaculaceae bacterium]|nr:hypothetical protein [Muribaculaceae bacterium]